MFNFEAFKAEFNSKVEVLVASEKLTRGTLRDLGNDVLYALHLHGDIQYVNQLCLAKLNKMNKDALILFFKEFTGFVFDAESNSFLRKDKKVYDEKKEKVLELLDDPTFNFWSWSETRLEITPKPFDLTSVTSSISRFLKKADKAGFTQADVLQAVLAGGFETDTLLAVLDTMTETA